LADTDSPLEATGGRLHGIYSARELAVGGIGKSLDTFALTLMDQFNSIHTQGQGSVGFSEVASVYATDDVQGPLDLAGYRVGIRNGQFQVQVSDLASGAVVTHNIRVQLTGATDDTSLEDIAGQLNAVSGLSASIGNDGRLTISADSHKLRFSFQNDSSNFLSAAGINTFFVGDSASNLQVNTVVANDPKMFAASLTGIGLGTGNAVRLAKAFEEPLEGLGGQSLKQAHEDMVVRITQDVSLQSGKSDGLRNFYQTLEAQHLGISGVNLDEEAIKMIFYQRMFQANSKIIQTSSEMLDVLVNL
jgi:flagellar hook-associated protein 1 FlgK